MQPYQQRVVEEKKELDEKIKKLDEFMSGNKTYLELDLDEQERLRDQFLIMEEYSKVLGERIAAFK